MPVTLGKYSIACGEKVNSPPDEILAEILNLQPKRGKPKAYQIKQVRNVIVSYILACEADPSAHATPSPGEHTDERSEEEGNGEQHSL
jgi:hypothetical protein